MRRVSTLVRKLENFSRRCSEIYNQLEEALAHVQEIPEHRADAVARNLKWEAEELHRRASGYQTMADRWRRKANIKTVTGRRLRRLTGDEKGGA
jgi:hypothetical protein